MSGIHSGHAYEIQKTTIPDKCRLHVTHPDLQLSTIRATTIYCVSTEHARVSNIIVETCSRKGPGTP